MNKYIVLLVLVAIFAIFATSCLAGDDGGSGGSIQSFTGTQLVNEPTQNTAAASNAGGVLSNVLNGLAL